MRTHLFLLLAGILLAGCTSPFQGIRFRAEAPAIDDGFRKVSLALQADGYVLEQIDPAAHTLLSAWRALKPEELSEEERQMPPGSLQGRIRIRFERRGQPYEVYATPLLRSRSGGGWVERPADVRHPLWTRWHTLLTRLLGREVSDGE